MIKVLHYFFVLSILLLASCTNDTSDDNDSPNNQTDPTDNPSDPSDNDSDNEPDTDPDSNLDKANYLKYGDTEFKLSKGLEEQFEFDSKDSHSGGQINITDGEFYNTQIYVSGRVHLVWRAKDASVWLYTKMYSPGSGGLSNGTYTFMPTGTDDRDPALANTYFFEKGKLGIDLNNDGKIESDDGEFLEITGGSIEFKASGDEYIVAFNVTLENDMNVKGSFTDDFINVKAA